MYFYIPNTTSPKSTYQDAAQTILNTNPVVLDGAGRAIIFGSGAYRQQLYDVNMNLVWDKLTYSPVSSVDLANTGVPGGAGYIGFDGTTLDQQFKSSVDRVVDSIGALRTLAHTTYTRVHVTGYYVVGDGGGGFYWYDPSDTTSADNNGTIIVASDGGRWKLEQSGWIDVRQFGAKGDGTTDDTSPIASAWTWCIGQSVLGGTYPTPWRLKFRAGIYSTTSLPNFGVNNAHILADGHVVLRNKGTGDAVTISSGVSPNFAQNVTFGDPGNPFTIESPTGAGNGILVQGLNTGCSINAIVRGAGATFAGVNIVSCVITTFNIQVAPYATTGWYNDGAGPAKPQFGILLRARVSNDQTSYCTFINPQAAACQYGYWLDGTLGNVFIGGDCEYNTSVGMNMTSLALNNKFYGTDFEVNTIGDVTCSGSYNTFDVDTSSGGSTGGFRFTAGSVGNRLVGGVHNQIAVDAGTGNYIGECVYQRGLSGNLQIIDNGTKTAYGRNWAAQQQKYTYGPSVITSLTVGASPFTYTNSSGMPQLVSISGGTVGAAQVFRGASVIATLATNSQILLSVGDALTVTYSSAPSMSVATLE